MMRRRDLSFPFISSGIQYGLLAALAAAELYVMAWVLLSLITPLLYGNFNLLSPLLIFLYSQLFGVLPALIIGGITGTIVGLLFASLPRELSVKQGATLGAVSAAVISLVLIGGAIYWQRYLPNLLNVSRHDRILVLFFDAPILLLYLCAGAWGGGKLARARLEQIEFLTKLSQKSK